MKKSIFFLLALVFTVDLHAFTLDGLKAEDVKERSAAYSLPAPAPEAVFPAEKMLRGHEDVYMNTRRDPAGREIEAHHIYGGFKIVINRLSKDEFAVTADIGSDRERWKLKRAQNGSYLLSGAGVAGQGISLGGGKYLISADVSDRVAKLKYMEVKVDRRHSGAYVISGFGMNLKADSHGVTGYYSGKNFSRKAAAVAISVVLVLQE